MYHFLVLHTRRAPPGTKREGWRQTRGAIRARQLTTHIMTDYKIWLHLGSRLQLHHTLVCPPQKREGFQEKNRGRVKDCYAQAKGPWRAVPDLPIIWPFSRPTHATRKYRVCSQPSGVLPALHPLTRCFSSAARGGGRLKATVYCTHCFSCLAPQHTAVLTYERHISRTLLCKTKGRM